MTTVIASRKDVIARSASDEFQSDVIARSASDEAIQLLYIYYLPANSLSAFSQMALIWFCISGGSASSTGPASKSTTYL